MNLSLGSTAGNPGYSIAAPVYPKTSLKIGIRPTKRYFHPYTKEELFGIDPTKPIIPGGLRWVGEKGGDTPAARQAFVDWYNKASLVKNATVEQFRWLDDEYPK